MRLTDAQRQVLACVAKHPLSDGTEIGEYLNRASYWAASKLKRLRALELVERHGQSFRGGYCYTISDAGRSALSQEGE